MFFADVLSAFQCAPNTLHLVCPPNHNIHLLQGVYGQYNSSCDQSLGSSRSCCPVNPMLDCMEVISSNTPHDWRELERKCQGQGRCEFDAQLAHMQSCPTHAQYMRVTFQCLSGLLTSHSLYSYFKNLIFYKWNNFNFYSSTYRYGSLFFPSRCVFFSGWRHSPLLSKPINSVRIYDFKRRRCVWRHLWIVHVSCSWCVFGGLDPLHHGQCDGGCWRHDWKSIDCCCDIIPSSEYSAEYHRYIVNVSGSLV